MIPKILLARNELADKKDYILFTGTPAFLAEVIPVKTLEDVIERETQLIKENDAKRIPSVGGRTEYKGMYYIIIARKFFGILPTTQEGADKLARIARRMADWYLYNVLKNR